MLKTTLLAAFVAVAACALAQDSWKEDSRSSIDATGKSYYEIKREVCHLDKYLSGGDAYAFEAGLDRMDSNVETALVSGLFAAHRQAVLIRDQIIATQIPTDANIDASALPNDQAVLAQETESSMRPMRMVMQTGRRSDVDYELAFDILTTDLNETQKHQLARWWDNDERAMDAPGIDSETNIRMKDIVCRLLEIDAKKADEPVYVSLYVHHTYPVIPIN